MSFKRKKKKKINKGFKSNDQIPGRTRFQWKGLTRAKTEASPHLGTKMLSVTPPGHVLKLEQRDVLMNQHAMSGKRGTDETCASTC